MVLPITNVGSTAAEASSTNDEDLVCEYRILPKFDEGLPQEIHQTLPDGINIRKSPYGYGVYANKFFSMGSVLYVGSQVIIANEYAEFKLVITNNANTFHLNTDTHSVKFSDSHRWLYLFDSFMNHSCDPTTISRQTTDLYSKNQYQTVALRDIQPGDEITCDYNLFEYDCSGKVIDVCLCGSSLCIGRIAGYRYLSIEEQKKRIGLVDPEVLYSLAADINNKFLYFPDLLCPTDRVIIEPVDEGSYKLVAQRNFTKDEVVYPNKSLIFPEDHSIVIEVYDKRKWLENLVYSVNKGDGKREFYYFDSFQNHSCDPNTYMIYHSENVYDVVAKRDIAQGEELTVDYESFDVLYEDGTTFHCKCGSTNCRGTINA